MIPRIIHQIWIGDINIPPLSLMDTWKECAYKINAEYILWNEEEINKRNMKFECIQSIKEIKEINGKADIMRWEILLKYGGIFIDADSICVDILIDEIFNPYQYLLNDSGNLFEININNKDVGFAAFENEIKRPKLIATGTMGFTPNHPLLFDIVQSLKYPTQDTLLLLNKQKAWISVGPGCITRFLETNKYKNNIIIFPSYFFIPIHYEYNTPIYIGHQKVYAHQLWGTGENLYGKSKMTETIPNNLLINNNLSISILIYSYNTPKKWLNQCLKSIKNQKGEFMIELIWIDNFSDSSFTNELIHEINWFKRTTRFLSNIKYHKMNKIEKDNICFFHGVEMCSNDLIIHINPNDIMISTRIQIQIDYMEKNPQIVLVGGQYVNFISKLNNEIKIIDKKSNYPLIINDFFSNTFINKSTLCYRKWSIDKIREDNFENDNLEIKLHNYFGKNSISNIDHILILKRQDEINN